MNNSSSIFSASDDEIHRMQPHVVVRWEDATASLRLSLNGKAFRRRKQLVRIIESRPGSVYLPSKKEHFVPTHELNELLRQFRDKQLSFAVHKVASERLKLSADLRRAICEGKHQPTAQELRQACLTPRLVLNETGSWFVLEGTLSPHRKVLFPDLDDFRLRERAVQELSIGDLPILLHRARANDIRIFIEKAVEQALDREEREVRRRYEANRTIINRERLAVENSKTSTLADRDVDVAPVVSEENIVLARPRCAWVNSGGRSWFLFESGLVPVFQTAVHTLHRYKIQPQASAIFPGYLESEIPDSKLPAIYSELLPGLPEPATVSDRFMSGLRDTQRRAALVLENQMAKAKIDVPLSGGALSAEVLPRLFPHQRVGVEWLLTRPRALLGDDMGLGKTLSVLTAFSMLKERGQIDTLLVLCPNSLTRNWKRETESWFPELRTVLPGNEKKQRDSTLRGLSWGARQMDVLILNYEAIRIESVLPLVEAAIKNGRTMLCVDESQRVKNHTTKVFQAISRLTRYADRRVLLSGTPTPQQFSDIWAQIFLLDDGERFGTNFYQWLETVAELGTRYSDYAVKKYLPKQVQEGQSRVLELLLRRKKEDVLNLPEKTFSVREIELRGDQKARYDALKQELSVRVSSLDGEVFLKSISSILEEYLRAVQLASNPRLVDPSWSGTPAKFEELDEIVEEVVAGRSGKIVVWTNFLQNVRELAERYRHHGALQFSGEITGADRDRNLQAFQNDPKSRVLVAIPAAGGVGITLTAAQTAVYVDKTWNAEHYLQSVDRLHRIGQCGTVNIIALQAGNVDRLIARSLRRKAEAQAELMGDNVRSTAAFQLTNPEYLLPTRQEFLDALLD